MQKPKYVITSDNEKVVGFTLIDGRQILHGEMWLTVQGMRVYDRHNGTAKIYMQSQIKDVDLVVTEPEPKTVKEEFYETLDKPTPSTFLDL